MTDFWKCECDVENPIFIRYCRKCSKEISAEEIERFFNTESVNTGKVVRQIRFDRCKKFAEKQDYIVKKRRTVASILTVMVIFLCCVGYYLLGLWNLDYSMSQADRFKVGISSYWTDKNHINMNGDIELVKENLDKIFTHGTRIDEAEIQLAMLLGKDSDSGRWEHLISQKNRIGVSKERSIYAKEQLSKLNILGRLEEIADGIK